MARRVYLILHHVLKELSSKRLVADQKNFAEIAQFLFESLWSQWGSDTQVLLSRIPDSLDSPLAGQPLLPSFERWLLLLKIMRRLILFGYPSDAKSLQPVAAVNVCVPPMVQTLMSLIALREGRSGSAGSRSQLMAMLERGILKLLKTQCQVMEAHPWSYHASTVLVPVLNLCCEQLLQRRGSSGGSSQSAPQAAADHFNIQCMVFIKGVLECNAYRGRTSAGTSLGGSEQDAPLRQLASAAQATLSGFWTAERLSQLTSALVTNHLVLTARDLEEWSSSPENYYASCDSSGWQEHVNLCAENLYLTMLKANRELLSPVVVHLLQQVSSSCPVGVDPAALPGDRVGGIPSPVLLKDAVYNAVAVGAYELHDYVDWTPWLRSTLLQELAEGRQEFKPVRRRVARLIAQWVARVEHEDRPAVYRGLIEAMTVQDACMQLTAVDALRTLIDDWNFRDEQFVEFVGPTMTVLVRNLSDASELDSQTQTFNLMNLIIERMGDNIRPYVEPILRLLPQLWQDAEGMSLVRIQVLLAMQRLVHVLGMDCPAAFPLVLPHLEYSINVQHPESISLMEDGLGLLLVAARNAPAVAGPGAASTSGQAASSGTTMQWTPESAAAAAAPLLAQVPALATAMASSTEHIQLGMQVLSSLVLLGGQPLLQRYGQEVSSIFLNFLGNVSERGMLLLFPVLDLIVSVAPQAAADVLQPVLHKLLALLLAGQESTLVISNAMVVYARVLLQNPGAFPLVFQQAAAQGFSAPRKEGSAPPPPGLAPPDALLWSFIDLWTDSFDGLASTRYRKTCALGLCSLLLLPSPAVLACIDSMLVAVTGVWNEQEGGADGEVRAEVGAEYSWAAGDEGIIDISVATASEDAEGEAIRRRALAAADPVNTLKLGPTLRGSLHQAAEAHGPPFQAAMSQMDPAIMAQLKVAAGL